MFQRIRFAIAQTICPIRVATVSIPTTIPAPSTQEIPTGEENEETKS